MTAVRTLVGIAALFVATAAAAQSTMGVVVDQTGLAVAGVSLQLRRSGQILGSAVSGPDGSFELPAADPADIVEASLMGFETRRVVASEASRIVLLLARASDETGVIASGLIAAGVATQALGSILTPAIIQQMPTTRPSALAELPLLPAVLRGPDGLLHLDGTKPHEAGLLLDGFDLTDPVTGSSAIDLPVEAVREIAVLRDPMNATIGSTLGALTSIETVEGSDNFNVGVEGFVPRPRFHLNGFGRIEGFFPRAFVEGRRGAVRYFVVEAFNFERLDVPGVTTPSGGNVVGNISATSFGRLDVQLSPRHAITVEGLFAPGHTANVNLSPLIDPAATPTVKTSDLFAGVVDRLIVGATDVLTVRVSTLAHGTNLAAQNDVPAVITPLAWSNNWFSSTDHWANREMVAVSWDRTGIRVAGLHTLTISADAERRAMQGTITDEPIQIEDGSGRLVRLIEFGGPAAFRVREDTTAAAVRDLWLINDHLEADIGGRIDTSGYSHESLVGPRADVKLTVDRAARTVIKAGVGRFVGRAPLDALAFGSFPTRMDTTFDPSTGLPLGVAVYRPVSNRLALPRADTATLALEHHIRPGLEVQIGVRQRSGSRLPTVDVPEGGGTMSVTSGGMSEYREFQGVLQQQWPAGQLFLSYVRSSTRSELNDFGSLFSSMDAPILQPGGRSIDAADTPNRIVAWGTIKLPRSVVVTPRIDWHTGFPYSTLDAARQYLGEPNAARFPDFFSVDLVAYKTLTVRRRHASLGLQIFNLTNHFNPRDVMAVAGVPQFGQFVNGVGIGVGGYFKLSLD